MRKITSLLIILSLVVMAFGPSLSVAEDMDTNFTETEGGTDTGEASVLGQTASSPVVRAVWQMQGPSASLLGTDDNSDPGAQLLPSGQYQVNKPISNCAVVSDLDGIADIDAVSSEVYYPETSFGADDPAVRTGCGAKMGTACQMTKLAKEEGSSLFCETIQNNNNNLPSFYDISSYADLCGEDGELAKETAAVYCCDSELAYDDMAGDYQVLAFGQDKSGSTSNILKTSFSYVELTAFEADFSNINYGSVKLNSRKIIEGDTAWNDARGENQATVRNVGNTRLEMTVSQNDMGMGKTEGVWNIRYGAKAGANASWTNYWPEETTTLNDILNLSKLEQIDFAIEILRFPEDTVTDYSGKMTINGQKAEPLTCEITGNN